MTPQGKNVPADEYKGDNFLDDVFFPDVEAAQARRAAAPKKPQQTPAQILKSDARKALSLWKQRTGISAYYIPYFAGKVTVGSGRHTRSYPVGKRGAADSFIAVCGTVLAAEAKAGRDVLSDAQKEFRRRWLKTGCPFVEYHSAAELIDALDQIAAQRGRGPFG